MQTWKTEDIPDHWRSSPESIRKYMGDWTYVLMTDASNREFVIKHFPHILSYYDNFKYGIQRADIIRYMWLYINGGLYLDLDYELLADISFLFEDGELFLLSSSNVKSSLTNSILASVPGHPIWLDMIEEACKGSPWWAFGKHLDVIMSTGPGMVDKVAHLDKYRNGYVLLPSELLNPYTICDTEFNNKKALLKPLEGGSWTSWDTAFYGYCYCYNWSIIAVILFIVILILAWIFLPYY
jgi:mannosyltransferase OCH1-like enzyme